MNTKQNLINQLEEICVNTDKVQKEFCAIIYNDESRALRKFKRNFIDWTIEELESELKHAKFNYNVSKAALYIANQFKLNSKLSNKQIAELNNKEYLANHILDWAESKIWKNENTSKLETGPDEFIWVANDHFKDEKEEFLDMLSDINDSVDLNAKITDTEYQELKYEEMETFDIVKIIDKIEELTKLNFKLILKKIA